jgi:hypothetical protein
MYLTVGSLLALAAVVCAIAGNPEFGTFLAIVTLGWVAGRPAFPRPVAYGLRSRVERLNLEPRSVNAPQPWAWSYTVQSSGQRVNQEATRGA